MILTHFGDGPIDLTRTYDQSTRFNRAKPVGLWLSDESDYGWSEWCRDEGFRNTDAQVRTEFRIRPGANVLHLSTAEQVLGFSAAHPLPPEIAWYNGRSWDRNEGHVDWDTVTSRYDGLLVTPYQWSARINDRSEWYYGWDVASACIWNLSALEPVEVGARA